MKHMAFAATLALFAGHMPAAPAFDGFAGTTPRPASTNGQLQHNPPSREFVRASAA
jgi:hypothetical protein